jgi:Lrp/AsnC family transcriptional regulator for asnA, asnC and gidA
MLDLDELDRNILNLLSVDSRLSYREIAKKLKVSHANISSRIRRLEDKKVIRGYTIVLDPEVMNLYPLCLRVSVGAHANLSEIAQEIAEFDKVHVVLRVSGDCEILALTMCENRQGAIEILSEISNIPGIEKAESHVVLESIKMSGQNLR